MTLVHGTPAGPARWFVIGTDMEALAALAKPLRGIGWHGLSMDLQKSVAAA
jgi:hypothetical protein